MKKVLKKILGLLIIMSVTASLSLCLILTLALVVMLLTGNGINEDLFCGLLLSLPTQVYCYWAWSSDWSRKWISKFFM